MTAIETKKSDRLANFTYAAPEQRIKGAVVDGRADVFSVGLIINEMFTKKVIAGANYETIKMVVPQYGGLDEIIGQMICQNPDDRLYPVEKIALHLSAALSKIQESAKLLELASKQETASESYSEVPLPTITECEYKDGEIYLHLDGLVHYKSNIWFSELQEGGFSHSFLMGYDTYRLRMISNELISMPVPLGDARNVKKIARNIQEWLAPATAKFNDKCRVAFERARESEARRLQAELEKLRAEAKIREALGSFTI